MKNGKVVIEVEICVKEERGIKYYDIQKKTFKDESSAVEWYRRNHAKIRRINNAYSNGATLTHFEIVAAIEGDRFHKLPDNFEEP